MSFWTDLVKDVTGFILAGQGDVSAGAQVAGPVANAGPIGGAITLAEGIWAQLTDGRMWRSLGWLILGVILMLVGVLWWIGPSAARRSPAGIAAGAVSRVTS